jgi:hypothetical protein
VLSSYNDKSTWKLPQRHSSRFKVSDINKSIDKKLMMPVITYKLNEGDLTNKSLVNKSMKDKMRLSQNDK